MANRKFSLTKTLGVSTYIYSRCEWSSTIDAETFESTINVKVIVGKKSGSTVPTTCSFNTTVAVTDATPSKLTNSPYASVNGGEEITVFTGTFVVPHNSDGSKTTKISVSIGDNGIYHANGSSSVTLDTIAISTNAPDITAYIKETNNIILQPLSTSYKHSVKVVFGNISKYIQSNGTLGDTEYKHSSSNIPFIPDKSFYSEFTGSSETGQIVLTTYSGSTKISPTHWGELTIKPSYKYCTPVINSITITEGLLQAYYLTNDINTLIKNVSIPYVDIQYTIGDSDDPNVSFSNGRINNENYYGEPKELSQPVTSSSFYYYIKNTRGCHVSGSHKHTGTFVEYIPITMAANIYRPEPTTGEIKIDFSGNFFNNYFDASEKNKNELSLSYKYREKGQTDWLSPTENGTKEIISGDGLTNATLICNIPDDYYLTSQNIVSELGEIWEFAIEIGTEIQEEAGNQETLQGQIGAEHNTGAVVVGIVDKNGNMVETIYEAYAADNDVGYIVEKNLNNIQIKDISGLASFVDPTASMYEYIKLATGAPLNTFTITDNTYSGSQSLGFIYDYTKQYEFILYYSDSANTFVSSVYSVTRGIPVFWWNTDTVFFPGNINVINGFATLTGTITLDIGDTTSYVIAEYPDGFTKDNCIVLAIGLRNTSAADSNGFTYGSGAGVSIDYSSAAVQRVAILQDKGVYLRIYFTRDDAGAESTWTYDYKIILMNIEKLGG